MSSCHDNKVIVVMVWAMINTKTVKLKGGKVGLKWGEINLSQLHNLTQMIVRK